MLNPNTSPVVTQLLHRAAVGIAAPGVEIETRTAPFGAEALRDAADLVEAARAVAEVVRGLPPCDGLVIAAFGDPGLAAARRSLACPVAGIGEAGLAAAAAQGRFVLLTLGPAMDVPLRARIAAEGLADRLLGIRYLDADIPEVAAAPAAFLPAIAAEAERAAGQGAQALLLGGAPFSGLGRQVRATIPVIDGLGAALARLGAARLPDAGAAASH